MAKMNLVYSREEIAERVTAIGAEIERDYKDVLAKSERLLVVGVLNGAFIFMADLVRALGDLPVDVDFVRLSSYADHTSSLGEVVILKNLDTEIQGRHVLVVEDIADCGLTLAWLTEYINKRHPASLKVAVAVDKQARRKQPVNLDYVGFTVDDGFLIGYGLDYAQKYRGLPGLYELEITE